MDILLNILEEILWNYANTPSVKFFSLILLVDLAVAIVVLMVILSHIPSALFDILL